MSQHQSDPILNCPKCKSNEAIIRLKRTFWQRLISVAIPIRRYECYYCGWQGVLAKQKIEADSK